MTNAEKEVVKETLGDEKNLLAQLKRQYTQASKILQNRVRILLAKEKVLKEEISTASGTQEVILKSRLKSVIRQKTYQRALKREIAGVLDKMSVKNYQTVEEYLRDSYENGFLGTMYSLQKQGIPLAYPIDQKAMADAISMDPKVSRRLYADRLGKSVKKLKTSVAQSVTRGIATESSFEAIAHDINSAMGIGMNRARRIARTETGRVFSEASMNSMRKAREDGADIVKQWDATMDGKTRPHHQMLDGQVRELDEDFVVDGISIPYPHHSGIPAEDINCRCVVLQRPRWVVLDTDGKRTKAQRLDDLKPSAIADYSDAKNFAEFRGRYWTAEKLSVEKRLNAISDLTVDGVWKQGTVSITEYPDKKFSIPAKKAYFQHQIELGNNVAVNKKHLADLEAYEKNGQLYETLTERLSEIDSRLDNLTGTFLYADKDVEIASNELVSYAERMKKTKPFSTPQEADAVLRPECGKVWRSLSKEQKFSIYRYTEGSGAYNRPLAGYRKPYSAGGTGWEEKYFAGIDKVWINYEGRGKEIRQMTDVISKSTYDRDIWLRRGVDRNYLAKFLDIKEEAVSKLTTEQMKKYIGARNVEYTFQSCGATTRTGFITSVDIRIFCPKGTQMMYAEPFSLFSGSGSLKWDGISGQTRFGDEDEVIIQRGYTYKITKMFRRENGSIYVEMECHSEIPPKLIQQDGRWTGEKTVTRTD